MRAKLPTFFVMRTGSPFFTVGQNSPIGERDTLGIWKWARDRGGVFVGVVRGDEHEHEHVHRINVNGWDELISSKTVISQLDPVARELETLKPCCAVVVEGAPATWSWPDNKNFAMVRAFSVRYTLPTLYLLHKLGIPRISIITDPKVYPRELEMATCWPGIRPAACLSQEDTTFPKRCQDEQYRVHAKYAACEHWCTITDERVQNTRRGPSVRTCAHSHFNDGRLARGRELLWQLVLNEFIDLPTRDLKVLGRGWDRWPSEHFVGTVKTHDEVMRFLAEGMCGPMIPQKAGFNTTKPRLHALAGNVPLLWGRGVHPMTYDRDCRLYETAHECRIDETANGFTEAWARCWDMGETRRQEVIERVLERTQPNFDVLERCILAAADGRLPNYQEFGGYEKL